eukprot:scaffold17_cov354-Pavlova_lutheri.AAC.55
MAFRSRKSGLGKSFRLRFEKSVGGLVQARIPQGGLPEGETRDSREHRRECEPITFRSGTFRQSITLCMLRNRDSMEDHKHVLMKTLLRPPSPCGEQRKQTSRTVLGSIPLVTYCCTTQSSKSREQCSFK